MSSIEEAKKKKKKCSGCKGKNPGLWCNICLKRARGEEPAKPGEEGYPKSLKTETLQLLEAFDEITSR